MRQDGFGFVSTPPRKKTRMVLRRAKAKALRQRRLTMGMRDIHHNLEFGNAKHPSTRRPLHTPATGKGLLRETRTLQLLALRKTKPSLALRLGQGFATKTPHTKLWIMSGTPRTRRPLHTATDKERAPDEIHTLHKVHAPSASALNPFLARNIPAPTPGHSAGGHEHGRHLCKIP